MNQTNTLIIGVDVSKSKLDIYLHPAGTYCVVNNNIKEIKKFFKETKKKYTIEKLILEATGGYEKKCVQSSQELGIAVHIAHSNAVHYFCKSKKIFAKTDRIDAKALALYGESDDIKPTEIASKEEQELEALCRRRQQLVETLTVEKQRIMDHLPTDVLRSIRRIIKQIENEIKLIDEKLESKVKSVPEKMEIIKILLSFKGVGKLTAMLLTCLLPELGTLNRAEIAALAGLAPKNRDSGTKQGDRHISGGRFHARRALYMVALGCTQHNEKMKNFYENLIKNGKKSKVALTAVMRKIIITLNAMLRDKKNWEPNF
jgi:transposase